MATIYFVTTLNCSIACGHCYLAAGPGKKDTTISPADFKRVIDNLPNQSIHLELTGGEVFTIKDSLYSYLGYLKEENSRRARSNKGRIDVELQTNGFWAKNPEIINKNLDDLVRLGVKMLDIGSTDKHHKAAGLDMERPKLLKRIANESKFFEHVYSRGASPYKSRLLPIGRAQELRVPLSRLYCEYTRVDCVHFLEQDNVTIREDGSVYACCFSQFPLPGNIIEDSFDSIMKRAGRDARMRALSKKGIKGLALHDGFERDYVNEGIEDLGSCGFCYTEYIRHGNAR